MDTSTLPFRLRSNSHSNTSLHDDPASRCAFVCFVLSGYADLKFSGAVGQRGRSAAPVPNSPDKRNSSRASLLVMASDALNFNFGRRRKSIRQPLVPQRPMPIILPDVIEISAAHKDEEVEERGRLREQAAQALGLSLSPDDGNERSVLDSLGHERIDSRDEPRDSTEQGTDQDTLDESVSVTRSSESVGAPSHAPSHLHHKPRRPNSSHSTRSPLNSSISVSIPSAPSVLGHGRSRSGSMPAALPSPKTPSHGRSSSIGRSPIPPFPSTPSALTHFTQLSSTFPKYHPPSSLRIFALSKQWKTRFMVLSSPPTPSLPAFLSRGFGSSSNSTPPVSYLHLFKSSAGEEKEIERLEINEDSVVFVAEEEVGGRKHVIKVGGVDVGAMRKDLNQEDSGRTMWFLQMTDSVQAQKWIASIKNAILNQRSMRAGLGLHSNASGLGIAEPRGDMDVMLSMRAQGITSSPATPPEPPSSPDTRRNPYASSPSSIRSSHTQTLGNGSVTSHNHNLSGGSSQGNGAVSALKGLFSGGNRPRSSSRATSICSDQGDESRRESVHSSILGTTGSGSSKGNSLMNLLRSNTLDTLGNSTTASPPVPIPSPAQSHFHPRTTNADLRQHHLSQLDRKIIDDPNALDRDDDLATPIFRTPVNVFDGNTRDGDHSSSRATRALTMDAISLQPPPRKRWTSYGAQHPFATADTTTTSSQDDGNESHSFTDRLSVHDQAQSTSTTSGLSISPGGMSGFSFGTPEERPRSPSMGSVSTVGSENGRAGSVNGERASINTKRSSVHKRWSRQLPQRLTPPSGPPPAVPSGETSSSNVSTKAHPYATVDGSPSRSSRASIPSFSKRASASSAFSISSLNSSQSHGAASNGVSHSRPVSGLSGISHSRPGSSHRASMSPPPRPAPTFALPPAPMTHQDDASHPQTQSAPSSAAPYKQSFRDSVSARAIRLSLTAPKPPPNTTLPPRPDENSSLPRRRAGSGATTSTKTSSVLYSIPGSPVPPPTIHSAAASSREPTDPLPLTPTSPVSRHSGLPPSPTASPAPSRAASIKQRLRILSTPSPSSPTILSNITSSSQSSSRPQLATLTTSTTPSGTPQAEKASFIDNNPSFATLASPVSPSFPTPKIHTITPHEPEPELTSLSPPPRRASKRVSIPDSEPSTSIAIPEESPTAEDQSFLSSSLSRHGSVISLGIVSM
uniref:PH domain-containing protein n=1 Tax=Moniliophthora roreri TaxID=221103 RepID=A0A0W0F3K1_MONRR